MQHLFEQAVRDYCCFVHVRLSRQTVDPYRTHVARRASLKRRGGAPDNPDMTQNADHTTDDGNTTVERRAAHLKDEAAAWAARDADFIALAGGPIRANRIYRRTQRGLTSPVTMHGVLIEPVRPGLWRVSRAGRHSLLLRAVEYHLVGKRRLLVVENE